MCEQDVSVISRERTYRLIEDCGEDQKKDDVDEVDGGDGNVEAVGLLVHPWTKNADGNEETSFQNHQSDCLSGTATLSEGNEQPLHKDIGQEWDDEIVGRGAELDVEETPFVQSRRVRVENVGWVLMHSNRAFGDSEHLEGGPRQGDCHGDKEEEREDYFRRRVSLCELPKTKDDDLRIANEYDAEQNALEHNLPSGTEILELVALEPASFDSEFTETLEEYYTEGRKSNEDDEEDEAGHEDIGGFNLGAETNPLDARNNDRCAGAGGRTGITSGRALDEVRSRLDELVSDLNGSLCKG